MNATERWTLAAILLAYLAAGALLITPYMGNADLVSYISIAQKYQRGEFHDAVNGYWSPLFSWLLVPFLALPVTPVQAAQILQLLTGLLFLLALHALSGRMNLPFVLRAVILACFVPILLFGYVFITISPDLLGAALVLAYCGLLFDSAYMENRHSGLLCAVAGALAYLAKNYNFFFFLLHFSLFHIYLYLRTPKLEKANRRAVLARYASAVAVFLVLCAPWVAALSAKYGRLTVSSAVNINLSRHAIQGAKHFQATGLFPPPNPTAVSAWEDPSLYEDVYAKWSPLNSRRARSYWAVHKAKTALIFLKIMTRFSVLSLPILVIGLLLALRPSRHERFFHAVVAIAAYSSGYFLIYFVDRYMIPVFALAALMGALLLNLVFQQKPFTSAWAKAALAAILAFTLLVQPATLVQKQLHRNKAFAIDVAGHTDVAVYRLGQALRQFPELRGRVASNAFYSATLFLCYYRGLQYYGLLPKSVPADRAQEELRRHRVGYFFYWTAPKGVPAYLRPFRDISRGGLRGLKIFDLRPEGRPQVGRRTSR